MAVFENAHHSPAGLMNYLINRFNYTSYLEIGCWLDETFRHINTPVKVGVDPAMGGTVRLPSDLFFPANVQRFDLVFVDGLHHCEQVQRDIANSLAFLQPGGTIVVHDCNPPLEDHQRREPVLGDWTGDVWKGFVHFRPRPDLDMAVVDTCWGCGIIRKRPNTHPIMLDEEFQDLTWADLDGHRQELLNLISVDEFVSWI